MAPPAVPALLARAATGWWVLVLLVAAPLGVWGLRPSPAPSSALTFPAARVVVVGVAGRYDLSAADRAVPTARTDVTVAAVSVRPRIIGDCAAAGWTTLGAGRRTSVDGLCTPRVSGGQVLDWPARLAAAAASHGDARLGTLAASVSGCVQAVGPGAALAAARPDGSVARYQSVASFLANGLSTGCPLTLVDAGPQSDAVVQALAARPDVALVVSGIGPPSGSHDPRLQLLYTVGGGVGGWLTSTSTRRDGVVTLPDLTRTLIDVGGGRPTANLPVDGAPLQVVPGTVTAAAAQHHLNAVEALSGAVLRADLAVGAGATVLGALYLVSLRRRRFRVARVVLTWACTLSAAMMLPGALPWWQTSHPALVVTLLVAGWGAALTLLSLGLARRSGVPVAVVGAAVTLAAFTTDALLGAVMEPGSLLNSRPVNGGRWYGFGNVTFAVYAAATLVVLGYLAHRLRTAGRPRTAVVAVALVGLGVVGCEGWPSMGADFGGVLVLTPVVLGLLLVWSGLRITVGRALLAAVAAGLTAALVSWLDWRRGPAARSDLGAFVQRVLDGDAQDIVIRKAVAAGHSLLTPVGVGSLVVGSLVWLLLFRRLLPGIAGGFSTIRTTALAALTAAVLGTLANDGGVTVWFTLTTAFAVSVVALATEPVGPTPDVLGTTASTPVPALDRQ